MQPATDLGRYLRERGIRDAKTPLPGTPCEMCVTRLMLPMEVAGRVVDIAVHLNCDAGAAFEWSSRLAAIVLSMPSSDAASTPIDALSALVLSGYVAEQRQISCDLGESPSSPDADQAVA